MLHNGRAIYFHSVSTIEKGHHICGMAVFLIRLSYSSVMLNTVGGKMLCHIMKELIGRKSYTK
ncbi:hypothetical protein KDAU_60150 [Dictyobacter aurantiacus]|uniref:Uncharacterized protein n=1 Tax=Dictyobacter aurantiacus TaxID=1936993 RepID=A0A401ZPK1_9CHLR|nr:hypothetical protein KDAU_60150 [Dictyobacter aurantiacus]